MKVEVEQYSGCLILRPENEEDVFDLGHICAAFKDTSIEYKSLLDTSKGIEYVRVPLTAVDEWLEKRFVELLKEYAKRQFSK